MSKLEVESIKTRIVRSAIWTTNSKLIAQGAGFFTTLILVRLLSRNDFGLMAMALSFMGLVDTFIDLGFLSAIIQAKDITQKQLSSCFWMLTLISLILSICCFISASYIGRFYAEPSLVILIQYLVPLLLFSPLNIVCKGILSRDIRLDILAKIELYAGIIKMVTTISLAYFGMGVLALVMGYMVERVLQTIACVMAARWYPRFEYDNSSMRPLFNYGSKSTVSSLLWYIMTKTDVFVIGRILGTEVLGLYTIASQFPQTIARLVPIVWMKIALPLFSKYQQRPELGQIVTSSSFFLNLICFPLFLGMAAIAPDLVNMLFGQRWHEAIIPLQVLSIVAAVEAAVGVLPSALNAIGRPGVNTIINFAVVVVYPFVLYLGAGKWGILGVLWGMLVLHIFRYVIFILTTCAFLNLSCVNYFKEQLVLMVYSVCMFCVVVYFNLNLININIYYRVIFCIIIGIIMYSGLILIFKKERILEFSTMFKNI